MLVTNVAEIFIIIHILAQSGVIYWLCTYVVAFLVHGALLSESTCCIRLTPDPSSAVENYFDSKSKQSRYLVWKKTIRSSVTRL